MACGSEMKNCFSYPRHHERFVQYSVQRQANLGTHPKQPINLKRVPILLREPFMTLHPIRREKLSEVPGYERVSGWAMDEGFRATEKTSEAEEEACGDG